jgi:formate dehydrogenase subunit gamma
MRRTITRAGVALLASVWLVAAAQSPAVDPKQGDLATAQAAQQLSQPLNNQPVWKEVRSGAQQYTSLPGRETSVLIQPEGQT